MMQMNQARWAEWAQQRIADSPKVAKLYLKQARQVQKVLLEKGCLRCEPLIITGNGEAGGPDISNVQIMHEISCPGS